METASAPLVRYSWLYRAGPAHIWPLCTAEDQSLWSLQAGKGGRAFAL